MNITNIALCITAAALLTACVGTPTWDAKVFPEQPGYGAISLAGEVVDDPGVNVLIESRGD